MFADQRIEFAASNRVGEALKGQGHVNVNQLQLHGAAHRGSSHRASKGGGEKIVSEVPQVKTVVNELQIAGTSSAASRSTMPTFTSKVKANFLGNGKFRPSDIKVVTEAGVGVSARFSHTRRGGRRDEVARGTGGVQKVVRVFEYVVPPGKK